jgi:FkbM family methyltransferase
MHRKPHSDLMLTRRFNLVDTVVILVLIVGLALILVGSSRIDWSGISAFDSSTPESQELKRAYGPGSNSEHEEEWIIRDYFQDRRDGVFIDVGANHYQRYSNTYYLETVMGWSGVAVEPQREFEAGYTTHRPRTRFLPFFVSDRSDEQATLYVLEHNKLVTSADRSFTERFGIGAHQITAPTITLNDLLATEEVGHFDFLSIDVELHEPQVLAGFDLRRFRPALVCIEAHPEVRQPILDYFTQRGYVIVAKYLRADTHNLYFKPMS